MVKTLSPTTETLAKPSPMPFAFQASGGPSLGHSLSKPVSGEWSSRALPRHWGQSAGLASSANVNEIRLASSAIAPPQGIERNMAAFLKGTGASSSCIGEGSR